MNYEWGDTSFIPELLGLEPDGRPYAEAWYGTHALAESTLDNGEPLSSEIGELRSLTKILAIAAPLSIQVHPNKEQAVSGFNYEEAQGISLSAPHRSYKDNNPKPETFIAHSGGLEARVGVKPDDEFDYLVGIVDSLSLTSEWRASGHSCGEMILRVLDSKNPDAFLSRLLSRCEDSEMPELLPEEAEWLTKCAGYYPGDPGVVVQMLLNYVKLAKGQAIHIQPGQLHAYLSGNGVEVMETSDNVIRAGLTRKHINIGELTKVALLDAKKPKVDSPETDGSYLANGDEYKVQRLRDGNEKTVGSNGAIVLSVCGAYAYLGGSVIQIPTGGAYYVKDLGVKIGTGEAFLVSS